MGAETGFRSLGFGLGFRVSASTPLLSVVRVGLSVQN